MWRNYVICVLLGLLLVSSGSSIVLLRQVIVGQGETDRLRQRVAQAESAQAALQQQLDQAKIAATATPRAASVLVPSPTIATQSGAVAPDSAVLQQIEQQVVTLRGLQPKADVPVKTLDQAALQRYFVDKFNHDYLPSERESDQKLLATLGILDPNDSLVQILLDVLQEQVIGVYDEDDKNMYLVEDNGQFGPEEKTTFAHEYAHALQDQYFDLLKLAPKHPDNDDRALAMQALTEGDSTLIQRLWAQANLKQNELDQLGQGASTSKLLSAPLFVREQLLFPYGDGFNFIRQIYQGGGYAAIDDVFRNPPESTEQILHVDKYRSHEKPVDVQLPDLSQGALGPGWRMIKSNVLGELDLRLILAQLADRTRAVRGTSGWGGDRWELLEKDGRQALVLKSVWDSENDARNFFEAFSVAMKNRFPGAKQEEASPARQALTAANAATEVRRNGAAVLVVISFDRPTADAITAAVSLP